MCQENLEACDYIEDHSFSRSFLLIESFSWVMMNFNFSRRLQYNMGPMDEWMGGWMDVWVNGW
jgi:hypothetical protein